MTKLQLFFSTIVMYPNASTDKESILKDHKEKAGIYLWTHLGSGKMYVGSAVDLSRRLKNYYSTYKLKRANNYICNALNHHKYSAFSLSILEYIDITNLSLEEARKLILEREQY